MTSGIVRLADKTEDARHWSPADMLREAISAVESGARPGRRAAVLFWDDIGEDDHISYMQAGMSVMEFIALLEAIKVRLVRENL